MKRLLLLLAVLPSIAFSGTKLADEYLSFTTTADVDVALCVGQNDRCGPSKAIKSGAYTNCGLGFVRASGVPTQAYPPPAGYKPLQCWTIDAVVTPPVVTPPVAPAVPACYPWDASATAAKLSTQPDDKLAWLGTPATSASWVVTWYCVAADGPYPQAIAGYRDEIRLDWLDALRLGTKAERDAKWVAAVNCSPEMDATVAACARYAPLRALVDSQLAATKPIVVTAPTAPTAPKLVVQPVSATVVGDRPVYRLKADGTRNTTAVSGKRAIGNTPCDPSRRIGTTNYYAIPLLRDASGDVYAVCVSQ